MYLCSHDMRLPGTAIQAWRSAAGGKGLDAAFYEVVQQRGAYGERIGPGLIAEKLPQALQAARVHLRLSGPADRIAISGSPRNQEHILKCHRLSTSRSKY